MYSRQHRIAKTGSDSHNTPVSSQFAPRPFVVQPQTEEVKPQQDKTDVLQTKAENIKEVSDGFPDPAVFTRHLTPPRTPRVQMKLNIGQPGDKYEQEADKVAADVVQRIHAPAEPPSSDSHQTVQHQDAGEQNEELQTKSEFGLIQREEMPKVAAQRTERVSDGFPDSAVFTRHLTPPKTPRVQMKLNIGKTGDKYEQEADKVAGDVVQRVQSPESGSFQHKALQQESEDEQIQTKSLSDIPQREELPSEGSTSVTPNIEESIQAKPKGDGLSPLQRVKQYDNHIQEASKQYGVPVEQIRAIIATESKGIIEATSGAAWGLMQITKVTWQDTTKKHAELQNYDFDSYWKDPRVNILCGTATLKSKMKTVGVKTDDANFAEIAVVAYNAGEGTVKIAIENAKKNGSKNPTADYLKPENLKPAIEKTGIYKYYLSGQGKKRNQSGTEEEAIGLKYQEITKYPQHVQGYLKEQAKSGSGNTTADPNKPQSANKAGSASANQMQVIGNATITASALNVRQEPASTGSKLGVFSKGEQVKITNKVGDWLQIDYQGKPGYISAKYTDFKPISANLAKPKPAEKTSFLDSVYEQGTKLVNEMTNSVSDAVTTVENTVSDWFSNKEGEQRKQPNQNNHATELAHGSQKLETLMAKERLTPEEIKQARELIKKESDEKLRGDLYLALQGKVEYHSQRDNQSKEKGEKIGDVMCNLTSLAMCLSYLGISNPNPEMQFEDALEKIRIDKKLPARTTSEGWGGVAKELGVKVDFIGWNVTKNKDWYQKNVLTHLRKGEAVMMSITGHIVRVQSVTEDGLMVDDPFGKANLKKGTKHGWESYNKSDKKWSKEKENAGEDVVWPWSEVEQHQMLWIAAFNQ